MIQILSLLEEDFTSKIIVRNIFPKGTGYMSEQGIYTPSIYTPSIYTHKL